MAGPKFNIPEEVRGIYSPQRFEADIHDCEIEGEIPKEIEGTFFRVGPDRRYPARFKDDSWFNGDGVVSMFRFGGGHVDFKNRYIHSDRYLTEKKARKALFGKYRNHFTSVPEVQNKRFDTYNTHIYWHAGKLLALKEDSPPMAINPHTLETEGLWDFHGALESETFTAHPKIDYKTGEMIAFGYEATGLVSKDISVFSVNKEGKITWSIMFEAPYVSMMHDMAITENYIMIPTTGFATDMERLKAGELHWEWVKDRPIYMAVIPRGGSAKDVRWIPCPQRISMHTINGYEQGSKLIFDTQATDGAPFPMFPQADGSEWNPAEGRSTIARWEVDLNDKEPRFKETMLFDYLHDQLPRMDDRFTGQPYSFGIIGENNPSMPLDQSKVGGLQRAAKNAIYAFDVNKLESVAGSVGKAHSIAEPVFVPRSKDAPEGDGFIIGVASNFATLKSELVIFDTKRIAEGPVGKVHMPFFATAQIHGSWVPSWDLPIPDDFWPQDIG